MSQKGTFLVESVAVVGTVKTLARAMCLCLLYTRATFLMGGTATTKSNDAGERAG